LTQQTAAKPSARSQGHTVLLPEGWPRPRGYSNGIRARGETVFVGGMVGWDANGTFPSGFVAQVKRALENIVAVLAEGGAKPEHVTRMTWYVVDMAEYRRSLAEMGPVYRTIMGSHYPVMALVEVKSLVEPEARLEIETTAVIPEDGQD
jgi:enamine deaminase RidA (YjgF/YER057c/UK114 family)